MGHHEEPAHDGHDCAHHHTSRGPLHPHPRNQDSPLAIVAFWVCITVMICAYWFTHLPAPPPEKVTTMKVGPVTVTRTSPEPK